MIPGKAGPEKVAGGLSSGCNYCSFGVQRPPKPGEGGLKKSECESENALFPHNSQSTPHFFRLRGIQETRICISAKRLSHNNNIRNSSCSFMIEFLIIAWHVDYSIVRFIPDPHSC